MIDPSLIPPLSHAAQYMLHCILERHGVYTLSSEGISQFLILLGSPHCQVLQESIFLGINNLMHAQQNLADYLVQEKFKPVSLQIKELAYRIIHEFKYLLNLKAYELFFSDKHFTTPFNHGHNYVNLEESQRVACRDIFLKEMTPEKRENIIREEKYQIPEKVVQIEEPSIPIKKLPLTKPKTLKRAQRRTENYLNQNQKLTNCSCEGYYQSPKKHACVTCGKSYHLDCLPFAPPDCLFCKMQSVNPFLKVVSTVSEAYIIRTGDKITVPQQGQINFKELIQNLKVNKLELVLCAIRTDDPYCKICWPDDVYLSINELKLCEFEALPTNYNRRKRVDMPIIIDPVSLPERLTHLEAGKFNFKAVSSSQDNKRIRLKSIYAFGVYTVSRWSLEDYKMKVHNENKHIPMFNMVQRLFDSGQGQDISIERITLRFIDPYSHLLIQTPVRGQSCNHAQCFDLDTFLTLQMKYGIWRCPVCNQDARCLIIDKHQIAVISEITSTRMKGEKLIYFSDGKIELEQMRCDDEDEYGKMNMGR